jgi:hypothetical protein
MESPILLKPIVLSVHSDYHTAWFANLGYHRSGITDSQVKESSSGFGFVVYTRNPKVADLVKYDLSHMF